MGMKIAIAQLDIAFGAPDKNKIHVQEWIKKASEQGAELVVLPELWTTGYDLTRIEEISDLGGENSIKFLKKLAAEHRIHIIGGSIPEKTKNGVKNTMLTINNQGELVKKYSKLHLFKLMDEHHYLLSGEEDGLFTLDDTQMAGLICYDIRFPEWIRKHVINGARVLFVVAEWPLARVDHWKTLLKARAIENQCFVIACNRVGSDPNNEFAGHSLIIDPWGDTLAEGSEHEELIRAEIDFTEVDKVRKKIPIFQDRRPSFY
jgi:omega-amidase